MPSDGIWVIVEQRGGKLQDVSLEAVSVGRKLADKLSAKVSAVLLGSNISELVPILAHHGADKVCLLDSPTVADYCPEFYTDALSDLIQVNQPTLVLCGHTSVGQDLAPRLAARLKTGLVTRCTSLSVENDQAITCIKPSYGDKASTRIVFAKGVTQIASIEPGAMEIAIPDTKRIAEVIPITAKFINEPKAKVVNFIKGNPKTVSITEAEVIVSGGAGVGSVDNWHLIEELAEALGASVSASRPAVDIGCVTPERQVGLSGKTVSPRLYIACGISGSLQHTMGMKGSKMIIAVNKDRSAPMVKMSDVKVVGDLLQLLPVITSHIREYTQNRIMKKVK
jgi:electron transfer flavoprotein alpha subunit